MSAAYRGVARAMRRLKPRAPAPFEAPPRANDPSPSRLRYRLDRLARRGSVRFVVRRVVPPLAVLGLLALAATSDLLRGEVREGVDTLRAALMDRPEFAVTRLVIEGGSDRLREQIARRIEFQGPVSSLRLDLRALRETVETTPGVATAVVSVEPEGLLAVRVTQRAPAALWRWEGQLNLVDADGVPIGPVAARADRPELPLIVGPGADRAAREALALWARAEPLHHRLRALVRVGERRWTVSLLSGQEVLLPAEGAEAALARLIDWHLSEGLLDREITLVDLRDPERPIVRLTPRGFEEREKDA